MDSRKTIVLDGIEYFLVPKNEIEQPETEVALSEVDEDFSEEIEQDIQEKTFDIAEEEEIISGYKIDEESLIQTTIDQSEVNIEETSEEVIPEASVKPSEHRQKYKEHRLGPEDVAKGRGIPIDKIRQFRDDNEINQASYKGETLFFGNGLEQG